MAAGGMSPTAAFRRTTACRSKMAGVTADAATATLVIAAVASRTGSQVSVGLLTVIAGRSR